MLNHLQDCQADYRALNRVYLPLDSFAAAGIEVDGARPAAARRRPCARCWIGRWMASIELLETARDLPRVLASRRLAAESGVIVAIARRLAALLRRRDPLAERVELGKPQFLLCGVQGPRHGARAASRRSRGAAPIAAPGRAAR